MSTLADKLGVSEGAAAVIAVLLVVQVALQLASLVDLVRQPAGTPPPGKWLWLLVILFGNLLGAVVYLAVGRKQVRPAVSIAADQALHGRADAETRDKARAAADELYGPERRP